MEYVRSIFMYVDAFNFFTIDVPAQMRAFVDYKAFEARFPGEMGERGSIEATSYNQKIVHKNRRPNVSAHRLANAKVQNNDN